MQKKFVAALALLACSFSASAQEKYNNYKITIIDKEPIVYSTKIGPVFSLSNSQEITTSFNQPEVELKIANQTAVVSISGMAVKQFETESEEPMEVKELAPLDKASSSNKNEVFKFEMASNAPTPAPVEEVETVIETLDTFNKTLRFKLPNRIGQKVVINFNQEGLKSNTIPNNFRNKDFVVIEKIK